MRTGTDRWVSYYYDTETGLYYLNARYYDPSLRRFLNADSLAFMGGGDAASYNLYAYCENNPVNRVDPTGCLSDLAKCGLILGTSILLIGAVSILTFGAGTAPAIIATSAFYAAAGGTAIGAGVGFAVTGTVDGMVEGACIGFGGGALGGAVGTSALMPMTPMVPGIADKAMMGVRYLNIDEGLNFARTAAEHMGNPARYVPMQIQQEVIRQGNAFADPRGSSAMMYYSQMYINEKLYNIEVLYDEVSNTVYHFKYAREAMGNLPAITK